MILVWHWHCNNKSLQLLMKWSMTCWMLLTSGRFHAVWTLKNKQLKHAAMSLVLCPQSSEPYLTQMQVGLGCIPDIFLDAGFAFL